MTYEQLQRLKEWVRAEIRLAGDGHSLNYREACEAEEALDEAFDDELGETYWAEEPELDAGEHPWPEAKGCYEEDDGKFIAQVQSMNEEEGLCGTNWYIEGDEE